MIEGGRPCDMILSEKNTEKEAKRSNTQDRVKRRKARMTMKLDVHRPFAHVGRVMVKAIET